MLTNHLNIYFIRFLSLLHVQSDDEEEDIHSKDPSLNQRSTKTKGIRRRQTIGAAQSRQYASHRTSFKQLQAKFRPTKQSPNGVRTELEEIPMMDGTQTRNVHRSASVREKSHTNPTKV